MTYTTEHPNSSTDSLQSITSGDWDVTKVLAYNEQNHLIVDTAGHFNRRCLSCEFADRCGYVGGSFSHDMKYFLLKCEGPDVPFVVVYDTQEKEICAGAVCSQSLSPQGIVGNASTAVRVGVRDQALLLDTELHEATLVMEERMCPEHRASRLAQGPDLAQSGSTQIPCPVALRSPGFCCFLAQSGSTQSGSTQVPWFLLLLSVSFIKYNVGLRALLKGPTAMVFLLWLDWDLNHQPQGVRVSVLGSGLGLGLGFLRVSRVRVRIRVSRVRVRVSWLGLGVRVSRVRVSWLGLGLRLGLGVRIFRVRVSWLGSGFLGLG
ncbi:hypothetical protein JZ751_022005 [Albula glossodonta]|uniref:Dipeptidylpeptidase IV N-terminal domain-containing protein n=1 Tax=Albula glossodonta TaxID=121402 RepID=A0A8T2NI76_9TELE|nr:hypothetical protein JZ751_022005 [Albula glossodonta]